MAGTITTAMCNTFKEEILKGVHDLETETLRVALIKPEADLTANYGAATTNYSDLGADELPDATGNYNRDNVNNNLDISGTNVNLSNGVAWVDFPDLVFSNLTVSAGGALIYNVSQGNKAVAVFDFGGTVTSTSGNFTIVFPGGATPDDTNAVIRIS